MNVLKFFTIIASILSVAYSYKILMICSTGSKSHYILSSSLAKGLLEAGHDVTLVSAFGEEKPPKTPGKYKDIILTGFKENSINLSASIYFEAAKMPVLKLAYMYYKLGVAHTKRTLEHPNFQELLKSKEKFDAVIVEQMGTDGERALAAHFGAPLIVFHSQGATSWVNRLVANPSPRSYISEPSLKLPVDMTFWQRVENSVYSLIFELIRSFLYDPEQSQLVKKYFPNNLDYYAITRNISLILLNSHESINQPVPLVPNMVQIGGFHVTPSKKLPKDLQKFMDDAKEGVIYFSLGTNVMPSLMDKELRDGILRSLGNLKQKVLWKFDKDELEGLPKNVKISQWFPQNDILGHPNVKLFITHGGLLSTLETVYHGVPALALPVFADQMLNSHRMEEAGFGISLPYVELTEEKFADALNNLLNSPKYQNNAKKRQFLMHDRPSKPLDAAVYWVEYTIRHGGTPHLRVAGVNLPWYQYYLIDVILFLISLLFVPIFIIRIFCKILCCKCKCKSKSVTADAKKSPKQKEGKKKLKAH